jgi:hypothetical protein
MNNHRQLKRLETLQRHRRERTKRPGVIVVMTGFCLIAVFAFVALSVDAGRMVLTETKMQNACDAASLAAAQEITAAVYAAGQGQGPAEIDANSIAVEEARDMAEAVAAANGVYIDRETDVKFGKRVFDPATHTWPIHWDEDPFNVVQVVARRTGEDVSEPDGQLPLAFGWSVGRSKVPLTTAATAFVEARDLVVVIDVSASMNDDSSIGSSLSSSELNGLLDGMWTALRNADPKWPSTSVSKFPSTGFGTINSAAGTYVSSNDTATIRNALGLNTNVSGSRKYPFPQAGRNSDGSPKNKPSNSTSDALWDGYINYVKNLSGSYNKKYGYRTLMSYLEEQRYDPSQSEDLWRTPHYPYEAVKNGTSLFLDFLEDLDFGDEVGLVAYGQWAVKQMGHSDGEVNIDITSNPITDDYDQIDTIQRRHQAGEYAGWTAMGDGILKAKELLVGTGGSDTGYTRYGARPTMLVMTDGQTNQKPSGWSMPPGFPWAEFTDYDGDGDADYTASNADKKYAFYQAVLAAERGITIHTLAVGTDADRDLMQAIAYVGGGIFINVPGGGTANMEAALLEAFGQIASKVPAAKLVYDLPAN